MSKLKNEEVQAFLNGNDSIFPKIFLNYRNKINYLAYEILHNEADCEEVVQNTFIKVIARRGELRDVSAFNSWIYRIAYNTSLDQYRRNKRRTTQVQYDIESHLDRKGDIDEVLRKKALLEAIQKQIDELPDESRELAILRFVGECSIEEISEIMNIPQGTVKSRLHRTKKKLREGLSLKDITPATYLSLMFTPFTFRLYASLVKYQSMSLEREAKTMKAIENATGIVAVGTATIGTAWTLNISLGALVAVSTVMAGSFGLYTALNPLQDSVSTKVVEMVEIDYLKEKTNLDLQVVLNFNGVPEKEDIQISFLNEAIAVEKASDENFTFIVKENGTYQVKYKNVSKDIVIDNIDKASPELNKIEKIDGLLVIRGTDDLSGIDFTNSYALEGERRIDLEMMDNQSAYFKDVIHLKAKLYLYDKTGNYQTYEIQTEEILEDSQQ